MNENYGWAYARSMYWYPKYFTPAKRLSQIILCSTEKVIYFDFITDWIFKRPILLFFIKISHNIKHMENYIRECKQRNTRVYTRSLWQIWIKCSYYSLRNRQHILSSAGVCTVTHIRLVQWFPNILVRGNPKKIKISRTR